MSANGTDNWPQTLWIVRHGESSGNVARDLAYASGAALIQIAERDMDVPLSDLGQRQADALGEWFEQIAPPMRPTVVVCSPYLRAQDTAHRALLAARVAPNSLPFRTDERLREREFGILDRLTKVGIEQRYPEQAALRAAIGKFYHRPPGGESWCDVILRLRSLLDTMQREYAGERILIVTHQVVVLCFRYLLEQMSETDILAIDRAQEVANCAVTSYEFEADQDVQGRLALRLFNFCAPLEQAGEPVTSEPDAPVAPH